MPVRARASDLRRAALGYADVRASRGRRARPAPSPRPEPRRRSLAGVVRGQRQPLLAVVAVEEVPEVPGPVAHVELGVVEVVDPERGTRPCGRRSPSPSPGAAASARPRPSPTARRRELALLVDDRREQRGLEVGSSARGRRRSPRSRADRAGARTRPASCRGRRRRRADASRDEQARGGALMPRGQLGDDTDDTNASSSSSEPSFT